MSKRPTKQPRPITIDFETFGIEGRPAYPPVPVGVSIKHPGKRARYYAWGHLAENNCTYEEARQALVQAWKHTDGLLFHHAKFDLDVAETHMGLPLPAWDKVHDTMLLLFLEDPNQTQLGLKPSAERLLGLAPEEQDALAEWLVQHQPVPGVKIGRGAGSKEPYGKYIAFAPGGLTGDYADGDVERTEGLFNHLWPSVAKRNMLGAYDRERELLFCLLDMERQGVRVDLKRLRQDVTDYGRWLGVIDEWARKRLNAPDLNLNAGEQLMEALAAAGKADLDSLERTTKGKLKSNKQALANGCTDQVLTAVLKYRTQLRTCLGTFMEPWLATAEASGGYIYTSWNQTKSSGAGGNVGARTGRLSSTPNFQNIPKEFDAIFAHEEKGLPKCPFQGLPPLPLVRSYVVPYAEGEVLIDRDYSQQEPRILAHFEGGTLTQQYQRDPWIDYHDNAKAYLEQVLKRRFERKPVKNINLGIIYGQGVGSLAEKNKATVEETKELKDMIFKLYPGLGEMYKDMKRRAKANEPIRTWGGREYFCEEPKIVEGRLRTFDYKMVNTLIQGSAADCTKEAVIRLYRVKPTWLRLLLQVHDQLTASVPKGKLKEGMELLRKTMESVEFDVLILSEGAISSTNWAELKDYDKKGVLINAAKR